MRWDRQYELKEEAMGTVIEMRSREAIDLDRVNELLARLEWRLDEPCDVPGCSHDGSCCGAKGESLVPVAA
jgi:hypothetical protein